MRLRPTQFVLLLLLACTVQVREDHVLRLNAAAVAGSSRAVLQVVATSARHQAEPGQTLTLPPQALDLDAAALAAHRTIWSMRRPAAQSASVIRHTGLLRA